MLGRCWRCCSSEREIKPIELTDWPADTATATAAAAAAADSFDAAV